MYNFPKVLVIGNTFQLKTGSGITMSNLFWGWPEEKIAVASINVDGSDTSICKTYYRLGIKEDYRPYIFNFFRTKKKSGIVEMDKVNMSNEKKESNVSLVRAIYLQINTAVGKALRFIGLYNFAYQLKLSDDFIKWFDEYKPEVIYAQIASYQLVHFVNELTKKRPTPLAIHFMDDHIKNMAHYGLMYFYWKKKIGNEFKQVISKAFVLMSICENMSIEYERRYNRKLYAFHNPVNKELFKRYSKTKWDASAPFTVLYAGRIGIGTDKSLIDISKAVEEVSKEGYAIQFNIQMNSVVNGEAKIFEKFQHTRVLNPVPYETLPCKLSNADLLVMPIDFQQKGFKYLKYSMPTKTSEYMISGTPILVYSPRETALFQYANEYHWGYTVSNRSTAALVTALKRLSSDYRLREHLGKRAREIAYDKHDSDRIRLQFRNLLSPKTVIS